MSNDIGWTIEEEEAWKELQDQLERHAEWVEENAKDIQKEVEKLNGTSRDATADRANSCGEEKKEHSGSPKYTSCECGYRDQKVPLASHSDWCGYKKWRLHEDKRKEYNDIRIWF